MDWLVGPHQFYTAVSCMERFEIGTHQLTSAVSTHETATANRAAISFQNKNAPENRAAD